MTAESGSTIAPTPAGSDADAIAEPGRAPARRCAAVGRDRAPSLAARRLRLEAVIAMRLEHKPRGVVRADFVEALSPSSSRAGELVEAALS